MPVEDALIPVEGARIDQNTWPVEGEDDTHAHNYRCQDVDQDGDTGALCDDRIRGQRAVGMTVVEC